MNNKCIELEYEGKQYKLEFSKATVKQIEAKGFNIQEFTSKPLTNIELAFEGAFLKNHPTTPIDTIEEILRNCDDKQGLIAALAEMIAETYTYLFGEVDKDNAKKVSWKTVDMNPKKN